MFSLFLSYPTCSKNACDIIPYPSLSKSSAVDWTDLTFLFSAYLMQCAIRLYKIKMNTAK